MAGVKDQKAKADAGKTRPTLLQKDFALALRAVNAVFDYGEQKYSHLSWRNVENDRWDDAARRHQQEIDLVGDAYATDAESNLLHRAHQIAGLIVILQRDLEKAASEGIRVSSYFEFNPPPQGHKNTEIFYAPACINGGMCRTDGTCCQLYRPRTNDGSGIRGPDTVYTGPTGE